MIEALQRWARTHTDTGRYSPVGVAFHWSMAFLVLFQLGWGVWIGFMPAGGDKISAYLLHAAAGLPVLLLALARVGWRVVIPGPDNDADTQGLQTRIAHALHYLFYFCFFAMPISGWAMWSATVAPGPLSLGGVVPWPRLPLDDLPLVTRWQILDVARSVHHGLALLLAIIVPLHVIAALKHHFWDHHDVLRGMLPDIPDAEGRQEGRQRKPRLPRVQRGGAAG